MTASQKSDIITVRVLFGDVWLCTGTVSTVTLLQPSVTVTGSPRHVEKPQMLWVEGRTWSWQKLNSCKNNFKSENIAKESHSNVPHYFLDFYLSTSMPEKQSHTCSTIPSENTLANVSPQFGFRGLWIGLWRRNRCNSATVASAAQRTRNRVFMCLARSAKEGEMTKCQAVK